MPRPVVLTEATWTEVEALDRERLVALLPVGAVEAHGPHLPLGTDVIIAGAMAEAAAEALAGDGLQPLILPPVTYTAAPFAASFPGTFSVSPGIVSRLVADVALALDDLNALCLAVANAHLDPAHLASLHEVVETLRAEASLAVAFPDLTRRSWASRLTEEFRSGACHAGRYEGSVVLARHPEQVREEVRRRLAPNMVSLSAAIREGGTSFREIGGTQAYFGDPAAATAEEGRETIRVLGEILRDAVHEVLGS